MSSFVAALGVLAALHGTVDVSDQSEARVRNQPGAAGPVVDLETTPTATIALYGRQWDLTAGYGPHLTDVQIGAGAQAAILHRLWGTAGFYHRRLAFSLYGEVSQGDQVFASLTSDPTITPGSPQLQPIPAAEVVHYGSYRAGCSAKLKAPRQWVLSARIEYTESGGLDAASRAVLPFQGGPRATIGAEYAASRSDAFSTTLDASRLLFSSGVDDVILQLVESWRHALGRDSESTLGAGVGWTATRDGTSDAYLSKLYPVATAAITHRIRPARLEAQLMVQLGPVVDRLNGVTGEWLQEFATLTWSPRRALTVRGRIGATQSFTGGNGAPTAFMFDEVAVSYRPSRLVELTGGFRSSWTAGAGVNTSSSLLWVAFVGVTLRAPSVRF